MNVTNTSPREIPAPHQRNETQDGSEVSSSLRQADSLLRYINTFLTAEDTARLAATDRFNHQSLRDFANQARNIITAHLNLAPENIGLALQGRELRLEVGLTQSFNTAAVNTLESVADNVCHIEFSQDGNRMASSSYGDGIHVWERNSGENQWQPSVLPGSVKPSRFSALGSIGAPAYFNRDGKSILSLVADSLSPQQARTRPHIWARNDQGQWVISAVLTDHEDNCKSAEFSPDGNSIVTTGLDGSVRIYQRDNEDHWEQTTVIDLPTADWLRTITHEITVNWARFSEDSQYLLTHGADETPRLWQRTPDNTWQQSAVLENSFSKPVFLPDNQLLLGTREGEFRIHQQVIDGTWQVQSVLGGLEHRLFSPHVSRDGRQITALSESGTTVEIYAHAEPDGWQRTAELRGHQDQITSVSFSQEGRHLVTTSRDRSMRIWQCTAPTHQWAQHAAFEDAVSRDGRAYFDPLSLSIVSSRQQIGEPSTLRYWYR